MLPFALVLGVVAALMLLEPHLSGTLLILGIGAVLMFVGGTGLRWFVLAGVGGAGAIGASIVIMPDLVPYAASRLSSWLDPFADPLGDGHQTIQSLYAIGSGGAAGLGLGSSRQKHLFVPEPQNDFIFSILCEELGFVGACAVILLFALLLWRGITLAAHAPDRFGALLPGVSLPHRDPVRSAGKLIGVQIEAEQRLRLNGEAVCERRLPGAEGAGLLPGKARRRLGPEKKRPCPPRLPLFGRLPVVPGDPALPGRLLRQPGKLQGNRQNRFALPVQRLLPKSVFYLHARASHRLISLYSVWRISRKGEKEKGRKGGPAAFFERAAARRGKANVVRLWQSYEKVVYFHTSLW